MPPNGGKWGKAGIRSTWLAAPGSRINGVPVSVEQSSIAALAELHRNADRLFADIPRDRPGCAAGVMAHGSILWTGGFGCGDLETGRPITADTVFNIASISKQMTAFAVLLLAQEGRLSLDESARRYVPELGSYAEPVTIGMLLHHSGGLADYMDSAEAVGIDTEHKLTEAQVLAFVGAMIAADRPAGTAYAYSNTGYFLLSLIVERTSGSRMKAFAESRILRPLGMDRSAIVDAYPTGIAALARLCARRRRIPDRRESVGKYRRRTGAYHRPRSARLGTQSRDRNRGRRIAGNADAGTRNARRRHGPRLCRGSPDRRVSRGAHDRPRGKLGRLQLQLPVAARTAAGRGHPLQFDDPHLARRTHALIDLFWDAAPPETNRQYVFA